MLATMPRPANETATKSLPPSAWEPTAEKLFARIGNAERRRAHIERQSTRRGAFTKVTLTNGFAETFVGRLTKAEAVRNAIYQFAKRQAEAAS